MTKETRANLLFIGIFLAISLPGAVILFKKKLDPSARPMYLPEVTRTRVAFNDPIEAPDLERYVPPLTGRWVSDQARAHGFAEVAAEGRQPVMSDSRRVQYVGSRVAAGRAEVAVLYWGEVASRAIRADAKYGGTSARGEVARAELLSLPEDVRKELVVSGFAKPPKVVTWCTLRFAELRGATILTLTADGVGADSVKIVGN